MGSGRGGYKKKVQRKAISCSGQGSAEKKTGEGQG